MSGDDVDVVVVGAGGGGYPAAFLADAAGRRVVMVDPLGNLGGDCLAEGCIPSKAVRHAGLIRAQGARASLFGLSGQSTPADQAGAEWGGVLAYKDGVQRRRYTQHAAELAASSIVFHSGRARIVDEHTVEVDDDAGATHRYRFGDLLLATGSAPTRLPIPGAELAITSHDLFRLGADVPFPRRPVIIGGGYIGVEVASMLHNFGATPVVVEAVDQLLPGFDAELAYGLRLALEERVIVYTGTSVTGIEARPDGLRVSFHSADHQGTVDGDMVVMATGRHPVLPEGVEHLGLAPDHAPTVDRQLRTESPHVYAAGDVNGRSMLFHSAVRQSQVAAHVILAGGQPVDAMNFESVPMTVFTEPEAAHVGLTEQQATERLGAVEVTRYDYEVDARAQILRETNGYLKMVWDARCDRLVGAQVLGADAAQLIAPLALAVQAGHTASMLAEVAFPHPMISEGISRAARGIHA